MDLKRIFRGWVLAILFVAIILVILYKLVNTGPNTSSCRRRRRSRPSSRGQVKSVTLTDVDQTIQLTTKNGCELAGLLGRRPGHRSSPNDLQKQVAKRHAAELAPTP